MKFLYLLTILIISCNGQKENTNDFEIEDPIIVCDDLTGNEYQYSRKYSKWITVDSISVEQANKMGTIYQLGQNIFS